MMADYVGDSLVYDIYVVNTAHEPMVGESPVLSEGYGPVESHGFHITEQGGGYYRVTSNPTFEAGPYRVLVTFRAPGDPDYQQLSVTWDVDPLPEGQDHIVYLDTARGTPLSELRRRVARGLRDYRLARATSGGSENTLTDIFNLVNNTDYYRGAEILCRSGSPRNIGRKRKVVASTFETGTITFVPPLPDPTQIGDEFDIFRFGRNPFMIEEYDQAINDAIAAAFPANREKVAVFPTEPFSSDLGYLPIPETLVAIYGVAYESQDLEWTSYPRMTHSTRYGGSGFFVDAAQRQITFGPDRWGLNGKQIVLFGYVHPAPLVNDNDVTRTDPEWIVDQAMGVLLQSNLDQSTFAIGQSRSNRADQLRAKMVKPPEPSTIWLG